MSAARDQGFRESHDTAALMPVVSMPTVRGGWDEPTVGSYQPMFGPDPKRSGQLKVIALVEVRDVASYPGAKVVAKVVLKRGGDHQGAKPSEFVDVTAKAGKDQSNRYDALMHELGLTEDEMVQSKQQFLFALWSDDPLDEETYLEDLSKYEQDSGVLADLKAKGDYANRAAYLQSIGGKEPKPPVQQPIGYLASAHKLPSRTR
jgi:hypothetical protein